MPIYNVAPKYTAGSPAQVDREQAYRIAAQEKMAWADQGGTDLDDLKGVVTCRTEDRGQVRVYDLICDDVFPLGSIPGDKKTENTPIELTHPAPGTGAAVRAQLNNALGVLALGGSVEDRQNALDEIHMILDQFLPRGVELSREVVGHHDGFGLAESIKVTADAPGVGNAAHHYQAMAYDGRVCLTVRYQQGPRTEPSSTPGALDSVLLAIVADRMEGFQAGPYACSENNTVLAFVLGALTVLKDRAKARAARGVLGTTKV